MTENDETILEEKEMTTPANNNLNPDPTVQRLLRHATKEQLTRLVTVAGANSGEVVSKSGFDAGDNICPTFKFPYPLPPRFNQFLEEAASVTSTIRLFPYGILAPEGILVQVNVGTVRD